MQKSTIINFCESWKRLVYPLWDTDFQLRSWFRQEGTEVSSFEEATGDLIQRYIDHMGIPECKLLYQHQSGELIKELYEKVHEYRTDSRSLLNSVLEEKFFSDPKWLSIVSLAKKVDDALRERITEVENELGFK